MAVFTDAERMEVWDRRQAGELNRSIGRSLGRTGASIRALIESTGGVRPAARKRRAQHLTLVAREEISRGLASNESLREIAHRLGRVPSTVTREVARNGGRDTCRAHRADRAAFRHARRPKPSNLSGNNVLRGVVEDKLADWWSPQQISGWLRHTYRENEGMHVSHETIYLSLFIQSRGESPRVSWRLWFSPGLAESVRLIRRCDGQGFVVHSFILDWCVHSEGWVASLVVVEDLEIFEDRVREFDAGASPFAVQEFDLHAGPDRFNHGVVVAIANGAHRRHEPGLLCPVREGP